jgi:dethiobiotin synthetase
MKKNIFITGTGTDVGKTYISRHIIKYFKRSGYIVIGLKPVASGGIISESDKLVNDDALILQKESSLLLDYDQVNPFCLKGAIAPHIASEFMDIDLNIKEISRRIKYIEERVNYDIAIIEGAGGWHVPLNYDELFSDLVVVNQWDVILVVGIKLGCINEAILTSRALLAQDVNCIGWIANCLEPSNEVQEKNIETLKSYIPFEFICKVNFNASVVNFEMNVATSFYC